MKDTVVLIKSNRLREEANPPKNKSETIHWTELYKSGKHLGQTTSAMVRGDVTVRKECKVAGDGNNTPKQIRNVIYDRSFVVNQIAVNNRFILTDCAEEEWLSLCAEIYAVYNEPEEISIAKIDGGTSATQ
jgi:hypothetical protein